jgi:hypothetical protein
MPIPFHDDESVEELGLAAFLHLEPEGETLRGCLLFLNARGEPQEFVYNRLELLSDVLWRPADRLPAAERRLAATLFRAATLSPQFLLVNAITTPADLFGPGGQVVLEIPVGRVALKETTVRPAATEVLQEIETFDADGAVCTARVLWTPQPPTAPLLSLLAERGLIIEPFDRAAAGLREAYEGKS